MALSRDHSAVFAPLSYTLSLESAPDADSKFIFDITEFNVLAFWMSSLISWCSSVRCGLNALSDKIAPEVADQLTLVVGRSVGQAESTVVVVDGHVPVKRKDT